MRISGVSLGISGREDSVNKNKGSNNLSTKTITLGVAVSNNIGSTTQPLVVLWTFESLDNTSTTDGTKALHDHVEDSSCQGKLPR